MRFNLKKEGISLNIDETDNLGFPVIFQHGLTGDAKQTNEIFPLDKNFHRITLECRAHGTSDIGHSKYFTITDFAEDVIKLIKKRKLNKIVIGGISMGAAIALRIAVLQPDIIRGLVLGRPAWITKSGPENLKPFLFISDLIQSYSPKKALEIFVNSKISKEIKMKSPDNFNSLINLFNKRPKKTIAKMIKSIAIDGPNITDFQVTKINLPTLIIANENDFIHPLSCARILSNMIKNSQLAIITSKSKSYESHIFEFRYKLNVFLKNLLK